MRNCSKDRFGHFMSTKHARAVERKRDATSYKAHRAGYVNHHNACVAYYQRQTIDDVISIGTIGRGLGKAYLLDPVVYMFPSIMSTSKPDTCVEMEIAEKLRPLHKEACGCNRFRIKLIDTQENTTEAHETINGMKFTFPKTRYRYKFFVRCVDHEAFGVTLSLDPEWGEM